MSKQLFYSFDVFDTCLSRSCGDAKNVFELVAKEVIGNNASGNDILDFRYIRCEGELRARKINKFEEVTFDEIYQQCDFSGLTKLSSKQIQEIELHVEMSVLKPIQKTLNLINELRSYGNKIAFISDMYLPNEFIKQILSLNGFFIEGDSLYVSCDFRKTKCRGTLFKLVSEIEKIKFSQWIHHGDNYHSDIKVPSKYGIKTKFIDTTYSYYEESLLNKDFCLDNDSVKMAVGISKCIRLSGIYSENLMFAADLIAPLYVSFVNQVLLHANTHGIQNLYFLARDGYMLYKIAQVLNYQYPQVKVHYIYASRKSLYLTSMKEVNSVSLDKVISKNTKLSVEERLDSLQITFSNDFYEKALNSNSLPELLLNDNDTLQMLKQWHRNQRENIINYFIQEGLATREHSNAIVDLRGSRFSQQCINSILSDYNYNTVYGYYLEANLHRINSKVPNEYYASFLGDHILRSPNFKGLNNKAFILEQFFSATVDKRTSHYRFDGRKYVPVFDELEVPTEKAQKLQKLHTDICVMYAKYASDLKILRYSKELLIYSLSNLSDFCLNPQKQYLKALLGIVVNETQYSCKPIIKKLSFLDLIKGNSCIWYDGSVKYTYGLIVMKFFMKLQKVRRHFLKIIE